MLEGESADVKLMLVEGNGGDVTWQVPGKREVSGVRASDCRTFINFQRCVCYGVPVG